VSPLRLLALAAALLALIVAAGPAAAATVVTACGNDNSPGGVNFESAAAGGGDIIIRCATGGNEIRFTREHQLSGSITIDGERKVALIGAGVGTMFRLQQFATLTLKGLTIRNPPASPADPKAFTGIVFQPEDRVGIELVDVDVSDTRVAFAVERLRARGGSFVRNGHRDSVIMGVVAAAQLELLGTRFEGNLTRPFLAIPVDGVPDLPIRGRIVDCLFKGNKAPAMWRFGTFFADHDRFENNGEGRAFLDDRAAYDMPLHVEDDAGMMLAGALELRWTHATIARTSFAGNQGMIGGAIGILHADVSLESSEIDDNRAGAGGGIAFMHFPPRPDEPTRTRLDLAQVKLRRNQASNDGGALWGNGELAGTAILISGNKAGADGGAVAWISPFLSLPAALPAEFRQALLSIKDFDTGLFELSQGFIVDNEAAGSAVDAQRATLRFGNVIAARNRSGDGGAALRGASVELASSTIVNNEAVGLAVAPGGSGALLVNSIIADNARGNCSGAGIADKGANLQSPDQSCGTTIRVGAPALDRRFEPGLTSAARSGGYAAACAGHPLVRGIDAYGDPRGQGSCSIGAVEASLVQEVTRAVAGRGPGRQIPRWLLLLVLLFLLLCFILGWLLGWRRKRARRARRQVPDC
jgi:hypothetical protein